MEKNFATFIEKNWDKKKPLLLALSGGPDSLCLYHLLLQQKIPFEIAHVNHRWRLESDSEALQLKKMAQVAFHEKVLTPPIEKRNLEDSARNMRLSFFREVWAKIDAQAVILGHQADDQAETVLKRVFEGSGLCQLKGLENVSYYKGLPLWRPLLDTSKKEILSWLEERNIKAFFDPTNLEDTFLRGRLRKDLLPALSKSFGKEVVPSLLRLGQSASELAEFVEDMVNSYRENMSDDTFDFSKKRPLLQFEWKMVLYAFFKRQNVTVSMPVLESVIEHLKKGSSCKEMIIKDKKLIIQKNLLKLVER